MNEHPMPATDAATANDIIARIGQLTRMLRDSLKELGLDQAIAQAAEAIPDARDRLDYVVQMTAQAAERALNCVEAAQPRQTTLEKGATDLKVRWDEWFENPIELKDARELVTDTRKFLGDVPGHTSFTNAQLLDIMMAQDFQDLTGQVIKRMMDVIQEIERQLLMVLIENILATFEMDEILWELREHSAGLNCGRWDYIFSAIRKFQKHPEFYLPDRAQVTMTVPFMRAYSQLVIKTCHRRNVHAMGGMAAQIPIKNDPEANEAALAKVRADKEREARDGHDGTWVAHPGLVGLARDIFDKYMPTPNQIFRKREDVHVTAADLLAIPSGTITAAGLRTNIDVGIQYMAAWLSGNGCVPIYNLMEDAATAEISRSQIWQWLHNPNARLDDGRAITVDLFRGLTAEVLAELRAKVGEAFFAANNYELAARLFDEISVADQFTDFLTLKAYEYLN